MKPAFYSARRDAPESISYVVFDLEGLSEEERIDPTKWRRTSDVEYVLAGPETYWEGAWNAWGASASGTANNGYQLRDPDVFVDDDGRIYLLYNGNAESSICLAELTIGPEPATKSLRVTAPYAGYTWMAGWERLVGWRSTGDIAQVDIEFSPDGVQWSTLAAGVENKEFHPVTVPDIATDSAMIRVRETGGAVIAENGPFAITDADTGATLSLIAPEPGQQVLANEDFGISYRRVGDFLEFDLAYSLDDGQTWITLEEAWTGGSYVWAVPDVTSDEARFRIRGVGTAAEFVTEPFRIVSAYTFPGVTVPSALNGAVSGILDTSALVGAVVGGFGEEAPIARIYFGTVDRGATTSGWDGSFSAGIRSGSFTGKLTGLSPNTTYYYRAYAENAAGSDFADSAGTFTTVPPIPITVPVVTTTPASGIGYIDATLNGVVTDTGNEDPEVTIYYGSSDAGATASGWEGSVALGTSAGAFSSVVTLLVPNRTYHYRAFAGNPAGGSWSGPTSFTTLDGGGYHPIIGGEFEDVYVVPGWVVYGDMDDTTWRTNKEEEWTENATQLVGTSAGSSGRAGKVFDLGDFTLVRCRFQFRQPSLPAHLGGRG